MLMWILRLIILWLGTSFFYKIFKSLDEPLPPDSPVIDVLFGILFETDFDAAIALARLGGMANIPCHHFSYVDESGEQQQATLVRFGAFYKWEQV